jgi:hypothetical protein
MGLQEPVEVRAATAVSAVGRAAMVVEQEAGEGEEGEAMTEAKKRRRSKSRWTAVLAACPRCGSDV